MPDWSVSVQLPADPLRQPSIDVLLLFEVCVVCVVVVWVVVELVSGVEDCWLGEVDDGEVDGDVDCCELVSGVVDCGELGEVCATAQAADSNRIAVIRNVFLIYVPPGIFGLLNSGLEKSKSSAKDLDNGATRRFALIDTVEGRKESC